VQSVKLGALQIDLRTVHRDAISVPSRGILASAPTYRGPLIRDVNADGTFPTDWHTFAYYSRPGSRRVGRVTKRHVERLIAVGLLEDFIEDETGDEYLCFRDWRSWVCPEDPTAAVRAARWRERHGMYGRRKRRPGDPAAGQEIAPHEEAAS
jgi:hypothetical protein